MTAPTASPPQDIQDLDKLTQLAVKLRLERQQPFGLHHWTNGMPLIFGSVFGGILWKMTPPADGFLAYLGAALVALLYVSELERRTNRRLERLEEALTLLAEEIAKRQRSADHQLDVFRHPTG